MATIWRLVFVTAVIIQGTSCANFCSLKEMTIFQIPENTTVGSLVGYFDINGNVDEVELNQERPLSPFMLNTTSREIILTEPLDFEKNQTYQVKAKCRQKNPTFQATLTQRILIKDINDNPPVFTASSYTAYVSELSSVGSFIFDGIAATDLDGKNLYMQYEVVKGPYSDYLRFDRASKGEVTLNKSLDYETMQSFVVEIRALDTPEDTNSPRRSAVVNLTINVQNEDDMDPAFSRDHYTAKMASNAAGGTTVNTSPAIYAEDQDLTDKSAIVYSIWDYGDSFAIDPDTAQVTLQKQMERGVYTAVLQAAQVDNPRRRAIATLTLVVAESGAQTRPPSFLKPHYDVSVLETTPVNHTLVSVQAVDPDFGSSLRYWLKDDINGMFRITPTADIQIAKRLDYEKVRQYSLEVSVTDDKYTASVMVKIAVEDVNDNNPEIRNPEVNVRATRDQNSLLATIEASDKDIGSVLSYSVVGDNRFSVNAQGQVFMTTPPESFPDSEYLVVILVQDNGLPPRQATAHVRVILPALTPTGDPPITATGSLPKTPTITATEAPTNAAVKEEPNDVVPIVLGVIAAVLLFVVIVLAILLVRSRKKRANDRRQNENTDSKMAQGSADIQTENETESRHAFKDENLEKVKAPSHLDPEGLAYRSTKPSNGMFPSTLDLNFDADHGETEDGATTVQHNPITSINHGYSGSDMSEMGRDMGDIRIQTSMTPYKNGYPEYTENDLYVSADMKTFRHSGSSCESLRSDSTPGSKKQLVKPDLVEHDKGSGKPFSWNNLNGSTLTNSNGDVSGNDMKPAQEKPEITVYF